MFYALLSQHNDIYDHEAEKDKLNGDLTECDPACEVKDEIN
jgi:hypothetical protein